MKSRVICHSHTAGIYSATHEEQQKSRSCPAIKSVVYTPLEEALIVPLLCFCSLLFLWYLQFIFLNRQKTQSTKECS